MLDSSYNPNYFYMLYIAVGAALLLLVPLFRQHIRERIWHWNRGETALRYGLAVLSVILSFMLGAAYLATLYPQLNTCTSTYTSSISITTSRENGADVETSVESSTSSSSNDCQSYESSLNLHNWSQMLLPPMARQSLCANGNDCAPNAFDLSNLFPANSLESYLALWAMSLASGFVSLYLSAYLLRDARKRKAKD